MQSRGNCSRNCRCKISSSALIASGTGSAMNKRNISDFWISSGMTRASKRLLLADAMEGAEAPDQFGGINAQNAAVWKSFLQDGQGLGVVGMTISRDQDNLVGDVKVGVARGKALAAIFNDSRHGQLDNIQWPPVLIAHQAESPQILAQDRVIRVRGIFLDHRDHGGR